MKLFVYSYDSMIDGYRVTMPVIAMLNVCDWIRANDRQVLTLIHANDLALFFDCCDRGLLNNSHPIPLSPNRPCLLFGILLGFWSLAEQQEACEGQCIH